MRVPASQAPTIRTDLAVIGNGAPSPQSGDPVFAPVPVARVAAEQASGVPADGGGAAAFSSETSSPPAAAETTAAADPDRLVAQLVGPLYERLRTELRRERIRRGSVHDRLG